MVSVTSAFSGGGPSLRVVADVADAVADLRKLGDTVDDGMKDAVVKGTAFLLARVKARASGRPGPRVQTGDYRRGIRSRIGYARGADGVQRPEGEVFSPSPQAARLEMGFVGTDVLGRTYNQPAYPHFAPAAQESEAYLQRLAEQAVTRAIP